MATRQHVLVIGGERTAELLRTIRTIRDWNIKTDEIYGDTRVPAIPCSPIHSKVELNNASRRYEDQQREILELWKDAGEGKRSYRPAPRTDRHKGGNGHIEITEVQPDHMHRIVGWRNQHRFEVCTFRVERILQSKQSTRVDLWFWSIDIIDNIVTKLNEELAPVFRVAPSHVVILMDDGTPLQPALDKIHEVYRQLGKSGVQLFLVRHCLDTPHDADREQCLDVARRYRVFYCEFNVRSHAQCANFLFMMCQTAILKHRRRQRQAEQLVNPPAPPPPPLLVSTQKQAPAAYVLLFGKPEAVKLCLDDTTCESQIMLAVVHPIEERPPPPPSLPPLTLTTSLPFANLFPWCKPVPVLPVVDEPLRRKQQVNGIALRLRFLSVQHQCDCYSLISS